MSGEIKAEYIFETEENYLCISSYHKTILYDLKSNMKKIKEIPSKKIYINDKIAVVPKGCIYHEFFEEEIFYMDESISCVIKKNDGSYLVGGNKNNIYQISFDEFGFVELISKVDSGYGYYEDDFSGDCFYSYDGSRYYSVGYIKEFENGDILTISDFCKIKKIWKL